MRFNPLGICADLQPAIPFFDKQPGPQTDIVRPGRCGDPPSRCAATADIVGAPVHSAANGAPNHPETRPVRSSETDSRDVPIVSEGGRFRALWRSPRGVKTDDGRERSSLTHIHFHLDAGERSRFHRVAQDAVWNLYHGKLCLWMLTEDGDLTRTELAPDTASFSAVVPASVWQAAEPLDGDAFSFPTTPPSAKRSSVIAWIGFLKKTRQSAGFGR